MRRNEAVLELKALLISRIEELARELAPDGVRRQGKWSAKDPTRPDRRRGSFEIRLTGPKAGSFCEWSAGMWGDVIDLIAYLACGARQRPPTKEERRTAMQWARNWLGLNAMSRGERVERRRATEAMLAEAQAREEVEAKRRIEHARAIFLAADPVIEGTLVDRYLASRGIELGRIPHREASLRFAHRLRTWGEEKWIGPAMVALFRGRHGSPVAVHCTWLRDDGRGKAPIDKPKLMFGPVAGAMIRLTKGDSNLTPEEHAAAKARPGCLVLTEGIEDGLTAAMACPEFRVWAAGSLGNLMNVPPLPCIGDMLVWQDNDWGKPQARRAFRAALEHLQGLRRGPVSVVRSEVGKDANDWLMNSEVQHA